MKLCYLNGEKVYVEGDWRMTDEWKLTYSTVQVCKHSDVIQYLNSMLRQAEKTPDEVPIELRFLVSSMENQTQKPCWEIMGNDTVFDDPPKTKLAKEPKLNVAESKDATLPEHKERYVAKDAFVNLNLLVEQIYDRLHQLSINISWAHGYLGSNYIPDGQSLWIPRHVRDFIAKSRKDSEKAMKTIREIQKIADDFKKNASQKPRISETFKVRVSHLNVIKGGQYQPMTPKIHDDSLLPGFRTFLEKERSCESAGDEATR